MKSISSVALIIISLARPVAGDEPRPDLNGHVTQNEGKPLAKATVFVYSAGPKRGTASVCPYCYADCRKK